jgi:hypothetical protein
MHLFYSQVAPPVGGVARQKGIEMVEALAELLKPQSTEFWGSVYDFQPMLVNRVWGDGKQLVQIFPISERPRYWVVRVDSTCICDDELLEILDEITDAIEEQFGCPDDADIGVGDDQPYFPMFDGDGTAWHFVR